MPDEESVFLFETPEVSALLADNATNWIELLKSEGVEVTSGFKDDPALGDKGGKDATTILLASAALVGVLTPLLLRVLSKLTNKVVSTRERVLVPLEDSHGQIVKDKFGRPCAYWRYRTEIVESSRDPDFSAKIMGCGIEISIGDTAKK